MAATSHDVARLAGVSQPTVSRALRDQRGVSASTRRRVREAARALGYVPIQSGRALSTQTTGRIGIVSAELSNPFYPTLIEPIHDRLADAGFRTILVTDRGDVPVELEPLVDGSLDGIIITTCERSSTLPGELARRGVPFVLLNRVVDTVDADRCVVDNTAGAALVADFLVDLGHTDIAAVFGPAETSTGLERARGFAQRLADHGMTLPTRLIHEGPFTPRTGTEAFNAFVQHRPTAVFCANDVIAFGVLNAARTAGVRIPDELTVVGFDDIPMASWEVLNLTTIRSDLNELASAAVALLIRRMETPESPRESVVLRPELIARGTHGPPREDP